MGGNGVVSWRDLLLIAGNDVLSLLDGRETQVIEAAERAYALHTEKRSSLPPAVRLGFPDNTADRIIAIPAYLGGELNVAGVKWIASVPENVGQGMERAHALMILNERRTGRPVAILEGSIISARRTAASAALAAKLLTGGAVPQTFGFVGCGPINFEVSRFLSAVWPQTRRAVLLDLLPVRAEQFQERLGRLRPEISCRIGSRLDDVLAEATVVSFATTAIEPYIESLPPCASGTVILNISLRDFSPDVILSSTNVVDDIMHVCAARTSVHLAEMAKGDRDFIRCSIGELILGDVTLTPAELDRTKIFSPFGLGILDISLAALLYDLARREKRGQVFHGVLPEVWHKR
jgi:2,3-diaminopropionate biosynthesis protein SbnB